MPATGDQLDHPIDDTVEIPRDPDLTDDLLAPGEEPPPAEATTPTGGMDEDDEYFEPRRQRRSRLTTAMVVGLIFLFGMLAGVLVGRALSPTPAAQVVYVLNDASAAPAPASLSPTPSTSPTSSTSPTPPTSPTSSTSAGG